VLLQSVCDNNMLFTDCYAGEAGSNHDACMLRRSELFQLLQPGSPSFPADTHILGDPAYPIMEHLLVPFKDTGRLGAREHQFNKTLSSARCTIERAFALLKGLFRRLKMLDMARLDLVPEVIVACCVLHNVCLDMQDDIDCDIADATCNVSDEQNERSDHVSVADRKAGVAKRESIANLLIMRR